MFLAWFSMKFYMDNANDSETLAYVNALTISVSQGKIAADATGHYAALAPYVLWPFTTTLEWVTSGYAIRGFAFARLFLQAAVYALAYVWYRCIGLGWLTSLLGLILLSTSFAFAELIRGWELDKLVEPAVFLLAGVAAWNRRFVMLLGAAALAALNRESAIFIPLVVLAVLAERKGGLGAALKRWPVWACVLICAVEVVWLRQLVQARPIGLFEDLTVEHLVYVTGGLCLLPLLATVWAPTAPSVLRRLFFLVAPEWVVFVLATDRLEQGVALLALVALVFVPVTLAGAEQLVRAPRNLAIPPT